MTVTRILIDDLPYVNATSRHRVEFYKDASAMFQEIIRIKGKHPMWHVTFETIEVPDASSPAKQLIKEHEVLHNKNINWRKCNQPGCQKLQLALAKRESNE